MKWVSPRAFLIGLALVGTVLLVHGSTKHGYATIDTSATPLQLAQAIASDPGIVTGAAYVAVPGGTPNGVSDTSLTGFPLNGSTYAILSTGSALLAPTANTSSSSGADDGGANVRGDTDFDVTILRIDLSIPSGINCLVGLDFRFLSEEYPEYVGSVFNDAFIAELDSTTWTTAGSTISAPNNFAFDPTGNEISVNAAGVTSMTAANAIGTTYDGATPVLRAKTPITPGAHSLYLSIFDQADHIYDSAVFIDNLSVGAVANPATQCQTGALPPPASTGKIAFVSERDGNGEIYVMNEDGSGQTNITNNGVRDDVPRWSRDGTQIAYGRGPSGPMDVWKMNADGTGQTQLTSVNAFVTLAGSWSPNGAKIAWFSSYQDSNEEIYTMNADGTGIARLTNNSINDRGPSWSPDGAKIAFCRDPFGAGEVYVMNADGTGQVNLTNNSAYDCGPNWSPDGTKIAFHSNRDGNREIYVMNADGSGVTRITNNGSMDSNPSWSPDGTQIAFDSDRDGNSEIYVMNANGTSQTRLTNNSASDSYPDWQSVPSGTITPTPSPTAPPPTTPPPTPTPTPPPPTGTLDPTTRVKYCNDLPNPFPPDSSLNGGGGTCAEGAGLIVGAHPDITTTLDVASGALNFSNVVTMFPNSQTIGTLPVGDEVGGLHSETRLGTLNQPCNTLFPVDYVFFNVALPNLAGAGARVDSSTNISWPQPEGTSLRFGRWGTPGAGPILAGGGDAITTGGTYGPLTAEPTNNPIIGYPHHLVRVFDRDSVPADGGLDSLMPSAVYGGLTKVAGSEWVPLYFVQFASGGLTTAGGAPLNLINANMGQPSVSVLTDPSATVASPSTITDFCTPLAVTTMLLGKGSPSGTNRVTNPAAGTTFFLQYNASLRDTDQDSYENAVDTCPLAVNAGSPRVSLSGDPDNDGIDNVCDPDDNAGPNDFDGDGFNNREDNCPLISNTLQTESELTAGTAADKGPRTDQIGDPCDSEEGSVAVTQNCTLSFPGASPCATPNVTITMSDTVANGRYMTVTNVIAKCIEASLPIDQDVDTDGYCKNGDVQGDGGTDSCTTTSPNSCFTRHNAWAASSPMMQMDTDGDKQSDALETYVGTDPVQSCSQSTGNNNEPMDNWMFDMNDSTAVNGQDLGLFANYPLGASNAFVVQGPFGLSLLRPGVRFDFNVDGVISGQDSGKFGGVGPYTGGVGPNNKTCSTAGINAFFQQ